MTTTMRVLLFLGLLCGAPLAAQVEDEAIETQSTIEAEVDSAAADEMATDSVAEAEEAMEMERRWRARSIVQFGTDVRVESGQVVRELVLIGGSAVIEGEVLSDVVVIGGTIHLGPDAIVHSDLVNVLGGMTIEEGAQVNSDMVVVGGSLEAPPGFAAGSDQQVITLPGGLQALGSGLVPWVIQGLMWGRVVVPGLPWMWGILGIISLVYLSIGMVFHNAIGKVVIPLRERPLSTFLTGLLTLVAIGPIVFVLTVTVLGIVVIPFLVATLLMAGLLGRIAVARRFGGGIVAETDSESRIQGVRSLIIGMAILILGYMVPAFGLPLWMLVGIFGLGGVTSAAIASLRKENPKKEKPPVSPPPSGGDYNPGGGMSPGGSPFAPAGENPSPAYAPATFAGPGEVGGSSPYASGLLGAESPGSGGSGGGEPFPAPFPAPFPHAPAPGARPGLLAFPRATFTDRLAAFAIDFVIVGISFAILPIDDEPFGFLFCLLVYFIGFWAWKGTTVGGILLQLRVVQLTGKLPTGGEAFVRGLSGILSMGAAGLGGFWILWDPEQQGWHDRIAGTYVVKVPRDFPH